MKKTYKNPESFEMSMQVCQDVAIDAIDQSSTNPACIRKKQRHSWEDDEVEFDDEEADDEEVDFGL